MFQSDRPALWIIYTALIVEETNMPPDGTYRDMKGFRFHRASEPKTMQGATLLYRILETGTTSTDLPPSGRHCQQFGSYEIMLTNLVLVSLVITCAVATNAVGQVNDGFVFPATGITAQGQAMLLAIDDVSLPLKNNLCFYISKPKVRKEAVLTGSKDPTAPDYLGVSFYGAVLFENQKFRMWFYATHPKAGQTKQVTGFEKDKEVQGPICYAESDDGITWTKPNLGQVLFNGSRSNNIIALPETKALEGVAVIKDESDPDPKRRYKMAYNEWSDKKGIAFTIRTATSSDGISWTAGPEVPLGAFMEHASLYQFNGSYFINGQTYDRSEGGQRGGRGAYVRMSPDFDQWLAEAAPSFLLPEPPTGRGTRGKYRQVHLGVGAAPFGNVLVGVYGMWDQRGAGVDGTTCDLGLVVSNDGIHFREPVAGHVFISRDDSPPPPHPSTNFPTILSQGNGILNVGEQTLIYHGRWRNVPGNASLEDHCEEIALATLPRDRWGALGLIPPLPGHQSTPEGATEGSIWSTPIRLPASGCKIFLNAQNADCMTAEISDERFNLLGGFSGAKSGTVQTKEGFDCPVIWSDKDLSALAGKTVRVRINLKKKEKESEPRLFAIYLRS